LSKKTGLRVTKRGIKKASQAFNAIEALWGSFPNDI
jgi:hypothetical protein